MSKTIKRERGFYVPKSYRLSEDNHNFIRKIGKKFGSVNLAINHLRELNKLNNKK